MNFMNLDKIYWLVLVYRTITYLFLKWDGSGSERIEWRGEDVAEPHLVASWCYTVNLTKKMTRKNILKLKKLYSPYPYIPVVPMTQSLWVFPYLWKTLHFNSLIWEFTMCQRWTDEGCCNVVLQWFCHQRMHIWRQLKILGWPDSL